MSNATDPAYPHIDSTRGSLLDGDCVHSGLAKRELFAMAARQIDRLTHRAIRENYNMSKHTQGEWEVRVDRNRRVLISAGPITVADCYYTPNGDVNANAKLIAAAPELLETLKFIVEQMAEPANAEHTLDAYRHGVGYSNALTVIAKATA